MGISLFAAPMGSANAVGEHALGMLLNLMNQLRLAAHSSIQQGEWLRETLPWGGTRKEKLWASLGMETWGKSFAKKLRGFDVAEVIYFRHRGQNAW